MDRIVIGLRASGAAGEILLESTTWCYKFQTLTGLAGVLFVMITAILGGISDASADPVLPSSRVLLSNFAASTSLVVFSIPIPANKSVGLAVIDRSTQSARVIEFPGVALLGPSFSANGERLLFVRKSLANSGYGLVSCNIRDWNCQTLMRTDQSIVSPVECNDGSIVFSSGRLIETRMGHMWAGNDLWILEKRGPRQLSNFGFGQLGYITCLPSSIVFSALGQSSKPMIIAPLYDTPKKRSDIYQVEFNPETNSVIVPRETLSQLYAIGRLSTAARVSSDGQYVAFLNTPPEIEPYRYDLVIADQQGSIIRRIEAATPGFSWPAFAGSQVLANQLFEAKYETVIVDLPQTGHVSTITFRCGTDDIGKLQRITLRMAEQVD